MLKQWRSHFGALAAHAGIFILYYWLCLHTSSYADDFNQTSFRFVEAVLESYRYYFRFGGRLVGHVWVFYCQGMPQWAFCAVMAASVSALIFVLHVLTYGRRWAQNWNACAVAVPFAVLWLALPDAWEIIFWRTGSVYMLTCLAGAALLIPFRFALDGEVFSGSKLQAGLFVLYCLAVPFTLEMLAVGLFTLIGAFYASCVLRKRKIPGWAILGGAAVFVGTCGAFLAPGNFTRATSVPMSLVHRLVYVGGSLGFKTLMAILLPLLLAALLYLWLRVGLKKAIGQPLVLCAVFLAAAIASPLPQMAATAASYRALSFSCVLAVLAFNCLYGAFKEASLSKARLLCLFLCAVALPSMYQTANDYARLAQASAQRDMLIAQQRAQGAKNLFLPELPSPKMENYSFLDTLRGNPLPWAAGSFAKHYGFERAFLLMDAKPEELLEERACQQRWRAERPLPLAGTTLSLREVGVCQRPDGSVVFSLALKGQQAMQATSEIAEVVFLSSSAQSSWLKRILGIALTRLAGPAELSDSKLRYAFELLDRTVIVPDVNTLLAVDEQDCLLFGKSHPRAGLTGAVDILGLRIKTKDGGLQYFRFQLPKLSTPTSTGL